MKDTKEIKALFHLLDDPDEEIYQSVSEKIIHYGKDIIPNLENYSVQVEDNEVHNRIETIIHQVAYNDTFEQLKHWHEQINSSLLNASIILAKYNAPSCSDFDIQKTVKNIYQSCWLELNNYLTPLEQINIINSIFYSMFKFTGFDLEENKPAHFYMNEVLETRQGNNYSLGILYQHICEMLDIPVFAIQLPRQFLLAYFGTQTDFYEKDNIDLKINFYIDPNNGGIFTQNDVEVYLKKYDLKTNDKTFLPLSNNEIMNTNIESLSYVYEILNDYTKADELKQFIFPV